MNNLSNAIATRPTIDLTAISEAIMRGNLAGLSDQQKLSYHDHLCSSLGLNPLTRPFEYIILNGKLTLYARKDATDQLRNLHSVSINITSRETVGDIFLVTARARMPDGREDEAIGAVPIVGLKGEALANAFMKAETKAKRRVTLSICGLGMLDESEVSSIPEAKIPSEVDAALPLKEEVQQEQIAERQAPRGTTILDAIHRSSVQLPEVFLNDDPASEDIGLMICPLPKFKGQRIKDIRVDQLKGYLAWFTSESVKNNREPSGPIGEWFEAVKAYLEQHD